MDVNYHGTVNLLEAIKEYSPYCVYLNPGSGEEYGDITLEELPINQHTELRPVNPYAVTKVAQDLICYVYHKSFNLNTIRLRTFNHEGPRRERYFGIASYAYQISKIKLGLQEKIIKVGHIDDKRNFTHVDDIVDAYFIAMEKAEPGKLYIVGSEDDKNVATFREVLYTLINMSGLDGIKIIQVPEFTRPTNVPYLIGDTSDFRNTTGWTPKRNLEEILTSIQNYWDQRVKNHPNL
jgi:GDP-4-dehydro-6-deoxy-D-mannose reductase